MDDSNGVPKLESTESKMVATQTDHDDSFWDKVSLPAESSEIKKESTPDKQPIPLPASSAEKPLQTAATTVSKAEEEVRGKAKSIRRSSASASPTTIDNSKIGLLGGKDVGKTFLFNGIIYRTLSDEKSGAISYYLRSSNLHVQKDPDDPGKPEDLFNLVTRYKRWTKYTNTPFGQQQWYRLSLSFKRGFLGKQDDFLKLEFLDGSGEGFVRPLDQETEPIWRQAFSNAGFMVFCLPMWAAFPGKLDAKEEGRQQKFLQDFYTVLKSYRETRVPGLRVRTILALTHADDDGRCSLREVINHWIRPFLNDPEKYLNQLTGRRGITRYLAEAQAVSRFMHEKFSEAEDALVARIPSELDFGRGGPWIIPISAVEGKTLDLAEEVREGRRAQGDSDDPSLHNLVRSAPVPVHVELPLLAALCESHNALM